MLTVLHPELYQDVLGYPIGVMAAPDPDGGSPYLIVKATKEFILAAKVSEFFKVYVCPVLLDGKETRALVFAFFDDEDEPLTIRTALVDDVESHRLLDALLSPCVKTHFFDEHGREFLFYEAQLDVPEATKNRLESITWAKGSFALVHEMLYKAAFWFSLRTPQDDDEAITVRLGNSPYGDSIAIQDARLSLHQHHGAKGFSTSFLEREEPGRFQEEDIIKCLAMCFAQGQIYHSPLRTIDREEICDVMVISDDRILIIQAKDSPNIERIAQQKMSRKRSAALSAFRKALNQIRGAESYIGAGNETLRFILDGEEVSIDIGSKNPFAIVILKEVFERDSEEYANGLNTLMTERNLPCYVISYGLLFELCYRVHDAENFFRFSEDVVDYINTKHDLPVINFHV